VAVILRPTMLDAILLWLEIAMVFGLVVIVIVLITQRWPK
jgi:hypothetical protein